MDEVLSNETPYLHCQDSGEVIRVILSGELTIDVAASLHVRLQEILASGKRIEIDGSAVDKIDTAVMQLLWACTRASGTAVSPSWASVSESLRQAADTLGLAAMVREKDTKVSR